MSTFYKRRFRPVRSMAASIGNASALLSLGHADDLTGIQESHDGSSVVITYKKRYVSVIKILDQKPLHTHVLKNFQSFHCPVVESGSHGKLVAVVDCGTRQELHSWLPNSDTEVEHFVIHRKISKLISTRDETIVAYEDGDVGLLSDLTSSSSSVGNSGLRVDWNCGLSVSHLGGHVLTCGLLGKETVCVAAVATCRNKENGPGEHASRTRFLCFDYSSFGPSTLSACCLLPPDAGAASVLERDGVSSHAKLLCLAQSGDVHVLLVQQPFADTVAQAQKQAVNVKAEYLFSVGDAFAVQKSSLVALDATHVAVLAISATDSPLSGSDSGQSTLSIWDTKYCVMCASMVLPDGKQLTNAQLWSGVHHVYTVHTGHLQAYAFEAAPSTVLHMLGMSSAPVLTAGEQSRPPLLVNWNQEAASSQMQDADSVVVQFLQACQVGSKKSFTDSFEKLKRICLQGPDDAKALCAAVAPKAIFTIAVRHGTKSPGGKGYWPHDEICFLVENFALPSSVVEELIKNCLAEKDVRLLRMVLLNMNADVPDASLVRIVKFALSESEAVFKKFAKTEHLNEPPVHHESRDVAPPDADESLCGGSSTIDISCPISVGRMALLNEILKCPCNDVLLVQHLRALTFDEAMTFLHYLHYMLKSLSLPAGRAGEASLFTTSPSSWCFPTMGQVADWLSFLMDAHYTQLMLSSSRLPLLGDNMDCGEDSDIGSSCRDTLSALHSLTIDLVQFFDELSGLDSLLSQLKNRHALPQKHVKGAYSIEVLHIY